MKAITTIMLGALLTVGATSGAMADSDRHGGGHHSMAAGAGHASAAVATPAEGEIKQVNKSAADLTIQHGELRHLDMPAMTMAFQVKDKAMIKGLKAGHKVRFVAEKIDGKFVVTSIERMK